MSHIQKNTFLGQEHCQRHYGSRLACYIHTVSCTITITYSNSLFSRQWGPLLFGLHPNGSFTFGLEPFGLLPFLCQANTSSQIWPIFGNESDNFFLEILSPPEPNMGHTWNYDLAISCFMLYTPRWMNNFEQIWKFWRYILYFGYLINILHIFQILENYEIYFDKLEVEYDAESGIQNWNHFWSLLKYRFRWKDRICSIFA